MTVAHMKTLKMIKMGTSKTVGKILKLTIKKRKIYNWSGKTKEILN